jgi:hypothetical protein
MGNLTPGVDPTVRRETLDIRRLLSSTAKSLEIEKQEIVELQITQDQQGLDIAGLNTDVAALMSFKDIKLCSTPTRILDATANSGIVTVTPATTVGGVSLTGATGIFGSVTCVSTGTAGSINLFPQALTTQPGTSNVNFTGTSGDIANGFFWTTLNSSRQFKLYRTANVRVILDIMGFSFS